MKKIILCSMMVAFLTACSAKVDGDGAEVKVDGDTKNSMEETLENAGEELEEGAEKAKAKLEDAGDAIKDGFNETKEELSDDNDAKVEVELKKD